MAQPTVRAGAAVLAASACVVATCGAAAPLPRGFLEYREAAERYLSCRPDGRALLDAFSPDTVQNLAKTVRRLDPERPNRPAPERWPPHLIAAAAVMHTDAAAGARPEERDAQILAARRLLSLLSPEDSESAVVPSWHATVAAILQGAGATLELLQHLDALPEPYRDRASFLLTQASAYELVASPLTTPRARSRIARGVDLAPEWVDAQRRAYHEMAVRGFRAVLSREPGHAEAAIRLGFLLEHDGRLPDAQRTLRSVRTTDPVLRYYATLLSARLHRRLGRLDDAERDYRTAADLMPNAQVPPIALAEVLVAQGRRADAATLARQLLMRPVGKDAPPRDPWLLYPFGQYWKLDALMDELTALVQRCG
jgi:tetratricopeptide (TPR) repeat protein